VPMTLRAVAKWLQDANQEGVERISGRRVAEGWEERSQVFRDLQRLSVNQAAEEDEEISGRPQINS